MLILGGSALYFIPIVITIQSTNVLASPGCRAFYDELTVKWDWRYFDQNMRRMKIPLELRSMLNSLSEADLHLQIGDFNVINPQGESKQVDIISGDGISGVDRRQTRIQIKGQDKNFVYPWKNKYFAAVSKDEYDSLKKGVPSIRFLHELFHVYFEVQLEKVIDIWAEKFPDYIKVNNDGSYEMEGAFFSYMTERFAFEKEAEIMMTTELRPMDKFLHWFIQYEMDNPKIYKSGVPRFLMHFYQIPYSLYADPITKEDVSELLKLK